MENQKFKPLIGKMFYVIWIPTSILLLTCTFFCLFEPIALLILLPTDLFTFYFFISPLFAYAELRESSLFVKFGFFMKKEIPYISIRGISKENKFYADSMLSIKNSLNHINVKYNKFELVSISVADNEKFVEELEKRYLTYKANQ